MLRGREGALDDQPPATAWTGQCEDAGELIGVAFTCIAGVFPDLRSGLEQVPDPCDIGGAVAISVVAVVADAVHALGQNMDEEPADELVDGQGHGGVPTRTFCAVVLDLEGHAFGIEPDQAAVGYRDAVRVTRQVGQHRFWSCEGFFGVYDPVDLAQWFEESLEGVPIDKIGVFAKEVESFRSFV